MTYAWPLASLRPVVLLILCPFFSELFLPWPLWWWPCLVLLPQWLVSSLQYPSLANVPQSRNECKCYPDFCLLSLFYQHFIWELLHFHGAKCHLFTNDFQINIFPPKWTFKKKKLLILEREEGRQKEGNINGRERERSVASWTHPNRGSNRNLGMCPDWESTQDLTAWEDAPTDWATLARAQINI